MDNDDQKRLLDMAGRLAGVGHFRFEVSSGRITWSEEIYRIHGLLQTASEPNYAQLLSRYSPESAALLDSLVSQAIATGEGYELEATIRRPDGANRFVATKAECVLGADGKVELLIGVCQDITQRTQAERFMRAVTDQIPAMVAYWDSNLRCRYANRQYRELFGRSPAEMVGISMRELKGRDLFESNEPFIRRAMSGEAQAFERELTRPGGALVHALARYIPDVDEAGRVAGMVVLVTDITELKATQTRLEHATFAADEARAQAEAALEIKSEFLSNISHELRTPLTGILGFSELLADDISSNGQVSRNLDRIRSAGADLLQTVNDLLDFSKLEAGQVTINVRPADPCSIGLGALDFFEPQLLGKNLSHAFTASDLPPAVIVDEVRVRQILLNLIGNAVKFTTRGAVNLLAEYDRTRRILRYDVVDTGPGVPQEHQPKLFQRFTELSGSGLRNAGGTGLGLAICKGLAEAMGGSVGFLRTSDNGSQFWLEIPCEPVDVIAVNGSGHVQNIEDTAALQGLRLLVVDDHPANRELVRSVLEPFGIFVVEAASGNAAVELANVDQFDIILLDILMPEMDGPTVARTIRSGSGPNRSARIIAFTAGENRELRSEWSGLFTDQLLKPFTVIGLLDLMARHSPTLASSRGMPDRRFV